MVIQPAKVIHARSVWLSGYHRLLEGYQANMTWLPSLAKVIHAATCMTMLLGYPRLQLLEVLACVLISACLKSS